MSRSRLLTSALAALAVLVTVIPLGHPARAAAACPGSTLYAVVPGLEVSQPVSYFTGVAGAIGNGYTGTLYIDAWNPDPANAVHLELTAWSEVATLDQTLDSFWWALDLPPGRSKTQTYDGTIRPFSGLNPPPPVTVPSGKVHFSVRGYQPGSPPSGSAPASVHVEQWLVC